MFFYSCFVMKEMHFYAFLIVIYEVFWTLALEPCALICHDNFLQWSFLFDFFFNVVTVCYKNSLSFMWRIALVDSSVYFSFNNLYNLNLYIFLITSFYEFMNSLTFFSSISVQYKCVIFRIGKLGTTQMIIYIHHFC